MCNHLDSHLRLSEVLWKLGVIAMSLVRFHSIGFARPILLAFSFLILLLFFPEHSHAKRVALIIGNAAYAEQPLKNPVNDARAVSGKLKALGFDVMLVENLTKRQVGRTLAGFSQKLGRDDEVVVYYAGHGLQLRGENYLPTVDAKIVSEEDVGLNSLKLSDLLFKLEESKARVKIVILDACRNNPYSNGFRSADRGLARVQNAPSGTLMHFATKPGQVAADGQGENGLYTAELLKLLDKPGLSVEQMFKQVTQAVVQNSREQQEPWLEGNLRGDFYFASAPNKQQAKSEQPDPQPKVPKADVEQEAWDLAKKIHTAQSYQGYLKGFPKGRFASAALLAISGLSLISAPATEKSFDTQDESKTIQANPLEEWRKATVAVVAGDWWNIRNVYEPTVNEKKWIEETKKFAQEGDAYAQALLGQLYNFGRGGLPEDDAEAFKLFEKSARQGNAEGQYQLGLKYQFKKQATRDDHAAALVYYKRAAAQGHVSATFSVGFLHDQETLLPPSKREAVKWYLKAANMGNIQAMFCLALIYSEGGPRELRNIAEGLNWYKKAAELGHADAQFNLGQTYAFAKGVPRNYAEAIKWYRMAADKNHSEAQFLLAQMYFDGTGIPRDYKEALFWYGQASAGGHADADYNLSTMYFQGIGVEQNAQEGERYFQQAVERGSERAIAQQKMIESFAEKAGKL